MKNVVIVILFITGLAMAGENFKPIDTIEPEKYWTICEGLVDADGTRYMYTPWGTSLQTNYIYKVGQDAESNSGV